MRVSVGSVLGHRTIDPRISSQCCYLKERRRFLCWLPRKGILQSRCSHPPRSPAGCKEDYEAVSASRTCCDVCCGRHGTWVRARSLGYRTLSGRGSPRPPDVQIEYLNKDDGRGRCDLLTVWSAGSRGTDVAEGMLPG